jgi:chaperone required for assembly of F1-ATPase
VWNVTIKHGTRRSYSTVSIGSDGALWLDESPVRTPQGLPLTHPSAAFMQAIAEEWHAQACTVALDTMPLTRMLVALLESDATDMVRWQEEILRFVEGDTLRYFAPKGEALCKQQETQWMPWLGWAAQHYGMLWPITHDFTPPATPKELVAAVQHYLQHQDKETLLVLSILTHTLTSCIMATALLEGACTVEEAAQTVWLEYDHQAQTWGEDAELTAKRARIHTELSDAMRFLVLSKSSPTL